VSLLQAQQALEHLSTIPEAGCLERDVAYAVPVMDAALLPKLQALAQAWHEIRT